MKTEYTCKTQIEQSERETIFSFFPLLKKRRAFFLDFLCIKKKGALFFGIPLRKKEKGSHFLISSA
jgi:hypothetical protein